MNQELEILQEDGQVIVCRKPAGIPVQTAKLGQPDMISLLKNYQARKQEIPEIYPVHRLDQPVEGIMVFAKSQTAAGNLSRQLQQGQVDKYYLAVVEGRFAKEEGDLLDYLLRDGRKNISQVTAPGTKGAKEARLHYRTLIGDDEKSLVVIGLETGRHHQIRVQMAHAGHPLAGDKKYNPGCVTGYLPVGLCSVCLGFSHPKTQKRMEFTIEPKGEAFLEYQKEIKDILLP